MNIIIPATGIGKRFKDAGYKELKPFIKLNENECILDFVVNCFDKVQDSFYFIAREQEKEKFTHFATSRKLKAKILVYEGQKLGPAGTLIGVKDSLSELLDESVIVSYCDFGQEWDYKHFLDFIRKNDEAQGIIPCYTGYHPHLEPIENVYAVCKTYDKTKLVYKVIEKYHSKDKLSELHSSGMYYFKSLKIAFEAIEKQMKAKDMLKGEYYLSISNNYLDKVLCYPFVKKFYQFGTPKDFEYAKEKLRKVKNLVNEETKISHTIILAAGRGERFVNLNFSQPKPFLPLGNSTIMGNILANLKLVKTSIICVGASDHEKYWQDIKTQVRYVKPNKIGAAYSYINACKDLKGDVLIFPCDLLAKHITPSFEKMRQKADAIIFVARACGFNYDNPDYFTWIRGDDKGVVSEISVKHRAENSEWIMIGSFYFKDNQILISCIEEMFDKQMKNNNEFFIDGVFNLMLGKYKICYVLLDNYFSFGTPQEYLENGYWM